MDFGQQPKGWQHRLQFTDLFISETARAFRRNGHRRLLVSGLGYGQYGIVRIAIIPHVLKKGILQIRFVPFQPTTHHRPTLVDHTYRAHQIPAGTMGFQINLKDLDVVGSQVPEIGHGRHFWMQCAKARGQAFQPHALGVQLCRHARDQGGHIWQVAARQ